MRKQQTIKTLHLPFGFYPDPVGGTEIYVESLCNTLKSFGDEAIVAAPAKHDAIYDYKGVSIHRYAISPTITDLRDIYGSGDPYAANKFGQILDKEKPDIVHLHALTHGVSLLIIREAKRRRIPVVFTYHTPTISCMRGTLLKWGNEVCTGQLLAGCCTRCTLHKQGLSKSLSTAISLLPAHLGSQLSKLGVSGRILTGLRMPEMVKLRHSIFHLIMSEVDRIVVLCSWTKDLLILNGVSDSKITISRHGLSSTQLRGTNIEDTPSNAEEHLQLVFLGRIDPTKGLEIVIDALRKVPKITLTLDIYGTLQPGNERYYQHLLELATSDPRVIFKPAVPYDQIISLLKTYHYLIVPSQCLETGPLVVLEAFAAGIPVVGSNLGGIAELVAHEKTGLLVESKSVSGWSDVLSRLYNERDLWARLRNGIVPPRSMDNVAQEMQSIYQALLGHTIQTHD